MSRRSRSLVLLSVFTAGTVGHVAFKQRHQATAGDEGATIIVLRVHTTGEPWRHRDDEHGRESGR